MPIVGYSRASSFSPLQVGWTHAYWAEGPEFAALGLSNGAAVATWPDEVGTADLAQATGSKQPTFYTAGLGSQPSVKGDGVNDFMQVTFPSVMEQALSMVAIATVPSTGKAILSGRVGAIERPLMTREATQWRLYVAHQAFYGVGDSNPHLHVGYFANNLGATAGEVDGTRSSTTTVWSSAGANGATVFSYTGAEAFNSGYLAFAGYFSGDVTTDPKWAQFKTWVTSHYGITVI